MITLRILQAGLPAHGKPITYTSIAIGVCFVGWLGWHWYMFAGDVPTMR